MNTKLNNLRNDLATIDRDILEQVARRNDIAKKIGEIKAESGAQIVVPNVEDIVSERYVKIGKEFEIGEYTARRIARAVIDESVDVQGRIPRFSSPRKICIIGGNGGMGRWLASFFSKRGHSIFIVDPNTSDCTFPIIPIEKCVESDIIIIATPVSIAENILNKIISLSPKGIIFDILSVKTPIIQLIQKSIKDNIRICSVHPMFGPHAGSVAGRNILILDAGCKEANKVAEELFAGGSVFTLPLEKHDPIVAYLLGLSHAVNLAYSDVIANSGFSFNDFSLMASTTFRKQSAVSKEVSDENAELYYSIQRENPKNKEVLNNLLNAIQRIISMPHDDFIASMKHQSEWYSGKK